LEFALELHEFRILNYAGQARLRLINYGGREIEGLRIRLRGVYRDGAAEVAGAGRLQLQEACGRRRSH